MEMLFISPKSLGCRFGAHVFGWLLEKFLLLHYIVHLETSFKFQFQNSIAEEPLLGETRVWCIIKLVLDEWNRILKFQTGEGKLFSWHSYMGSKAMPISLCVSFNYNKLYNLENITWYEFSAKSFIY